MTALLDDVKRALPVEPFVHFFMQREPQSDCNMQLKLQRWFSEENCVRCLELMNDASSR
jgi:hypothetical protein